MRQQTRSDNHLASRAKLPADSLEALRELTRILGGSRKSVAAFFGQIAAKQTPRALARKLTARRTKLRKTR